jgi:hypothetical protein
MHYRKTAQIPNRLLQKDAIIGILLILQDLKVTNNPKQI